MNDEVRSDECFITHKPQITWAAFIISSYKWFRTLEHETRVSKQKYLCLRSLGTNLFLNISKGWHWSQYLWRLTACKYPGNKSWHLRLWPVNIIQSPDWVILCCDNGLAGTGPGPHIPQANCRLQTPDSAPRLHCLCSDPESSGLPVFVSWHGRVGLASVSVHGMVRWYFLVKYFRW